MSTLTKIIIAAVIAFLIFYSGCSLGKKSCPDLVAGKSDTVVVWKDIIVRDTIKAKSPQLKPVIIHDSIPFEVLKSDHSKDSILQAFYSTVIIPRLYEDSLFRAEGVDTLREMQLSPSSLIIAYKGKEKTVTITNTEYKQSLRLCFTGSLSFTGRTINDVSPGLVLVGKSNLMAGIDYGLLSKDIQITLGYRLMGK